MIVLENVILPNVVDYQSTYKQGTLNEGEGSVQLTYWLR
jgi:hypothetical protein